MKSINRIFIIACVIGLLFTGWRILSSQSEMNKFYFQVVMKSSADNVATLYFDTGQGLSEKDSAVVQIYGDQQFHDYQFQLPRGIIKQLRFDPLASAGRVTLASVKVINGLGYRIHTIDFRQLKAAHQIMSIDVHGEEAIIVTEDKATDPQLSIKFDSPLSLEYFNKAFFFFCAGIVVEFLLISFLISGLLWGWFRWPGGALRTIMVIALIVLGWRCWMLYQEAKISYLQVSLKSSVEGQAQLYYDKGGGFNEADSVKTKVWIDGRYHNYRFRLPGETLYGFRFDPFNAGGTMHFKSMEIVNGLGHRLQTIDLNKWQPANQIQGFNFRNDELAIVTEEGVSDPQMFMGFTYPLKLDKTGSFLSASLIGRALLEFIIVIIISSLIFIAMKDSSVSTAKRSGILWLSDALYLLACLYLLHIYSKGKWQDTIAFIQNWLSG